MNDWLQTALQTYLLHPEHGNGYQWWSGAGSDLGEFTLAGAVLGTLWAFYQHHQCEEPGCRKWGHPHPDHLRPVCRDHYHSPAVEPKPRAHPEPA